MSVFIRKTRLSPIIARDYVCLHIFTVVFTFWLNVCTKYQMDKYMPEEKFKVSLKLLLKKSGTLLKTPWRQIELLLDSWGLE